MTRDKATMKASVLRFGEIDMDGYNHGIVNDAGKVKKRKKNVSKWFRDDYGHTPLSANEAVSSYRLFGAGLYPAWIASCSVMYLPFFVVP
jgi:hypothetical protein